MKPARIVAILLAVTTVPIATRAQSPPSFQPRTSTMLGTDKARTPSPFTQVITQDAGELGIAHLVERFINLTPNWPRLASTILTGRKPAIAYTSVAWDDQIIRVTCWVDRANSRLAQGHLRVVMEVTEATSPDIPPGTIYALSDSQLSRESGFTTLTTLVPITPELLPDVLPTSMSIATQIVPDLWTTGKPGAVSLEYTFTSVPPPDGSAPIVRTVREDHPIR